MDSYLTFLFFILVVVFVYQIARRSASGAGARGAVLSIRDRRSSEAPDAGPLYKLASRVNQEVGHPSDLLNDPAFAQGVDLLAGEDYPVDRVLAYATGSHFMVACMALEALTRRPADPEVRERLLEAIGIAGYAEQFFFFRAIPAHSPEGAPLLGEVLLAIARRRDPNWLRFAPLMIDSVAEFAYARVSEGERPTFGGGLDRLEAEAPLHLRQFLDRLTVAGLEPLREELREWERKRLDVKYLESVGKLLGDETEAGLVEHEALKNVVAELERAFAGDAPRSVLLVGESGTGKSAAARVLFRRLRREGWQVFEAGSGEILAGQRYVGDLEERLRNLVRQLDARRRVLWYIPDFHRLVWAGRHQFSATSALDYLLPHIERGELVVLGESDTTGYEQLLQFKVRVSTALQTVRVAPLPAEETLALGRAWFRECATAVTDETTLREALQLAQQFLGDVAPPGNLLKLLGQTDDRMAAGRPEDITGPPVMTPDDLIVTLSQLTGLPRSILDEREGLELEALARLFRSRVMGQPEAVDCLAERVAMFKAGVTDPTRPAGVFLFAGPTGTGKTEIAKTLAEFLFGSPERMVRLDMSEMQTPESLVRLLGDPSDETATRRSLVNEIRKQPFSVVLLDEFEKAHPNVWDLFLQVFDDGRLTDRHGTVANFRHAIIILTSNLGTMAARTSLGFSDLSGGFRDTEIRRAIEQAFRPELRNRIDRIVIFRPLTRETMREILHKELEEVFERRGLRNRGWAVEWDDAAIEFLLERGFTKDLGARPLRRAIERYLLAPLALTIVKHQAPAGDQFLFVRAEEEKLQVVFVDPDAPEEPAPEAEPEEIPEELPGTAALRRLVSRPRGTTREVELLGVRLEQLKQTVAREEWSGRKGGDMARFSEADFWRSPERFRVLGRVEYMDRIEAGLQRSTALYERIAGRSRSGRPQYPSAMVRRLAQQVYLLGMACDDVLQARPHEAFLLVEAGRGTGRGGKRRAEFARDLGRMYREWARRRGMQIEVLEEKSDDECSYQLLLSVSGYGAHSILQPEDGIHVLEEPAGEWKHDQKRYQVRVHVAPQPDTPPATRDGVAPAHALRRQALEVFGQADTGHLTIVRRYRTAPSPLVRDMVRHWRTGLYDEVLAGDFDLMTGSPGGGD